MTKYFHYGLVASLVLGSVSARAEYPEHPLRIILPAKSVAGDGGYMLQDFAPILAKHLKTKYLIETFPNAKESDPAAFSAFKSAPKDGYTLMYITASSLGIRFGLNGRDQSILDAMEVIDIISMHPLVCVTDPASPYRDWKKFVEKLKTQPSEIHHVFWGTSSTLYPTYFMRLMGIRYDRISRSKITLPDSPLTALKDRRSDFSCWTMMSVAEKINSGEVAPIFSNSLQKFEGFQGIPLARNIGIKEAEKYLYWAALVVPKGTPSGIIKKIRSALLQVAKDSEWKNTQSLRFGINTIGKFPSPQKFIDEQNDFFENLAILSRIAPVQQ